MRQKMMPYLYVTLGSALGGVLRYALTRLTLQLSSSFPFGTVLINVLGSFLIGYFGTLTLEGTRFEVSENTRLFVMVGVCGGFTTFSSFSLQTLDLLRSGAWGRALLNVALSVLLCLGAVALGHVLAQRATARAEIAQVAEEEFTG
ncbi:MAG: fluoride efflux transporter CrcB [Acidobacteriaceae bacterium]